MKAGHSVASVGSELEQLQRLVAVARLRFAELEVESAREKARWDVTQAVLFRQLREHSLKRDHLRLAVHYRQKFLDSFVRDNTEEAEHAEHDLRQAKAELDKDYAEMAAAMERKQPLTAEETAELARCWNNLVKLRQPDRFASEPDNLAAYHKLTAAVDQAKDTGDAATLREIADDPQGYLLRQGWVKLEFGDPVEPAQLRRLHGTLQNEIAAAEEALKKLRENPDYELCQLAGRRPDGLDEWAAERARQIEFESAELAAQAERLATEIKRLSGKSVQ